MSESLDDFFDEEWLNGSQLRDETVLIRDYLAGDMTAQTAAQRIAQSLQSRKTPLHDGQYDLSELLNNTIVFAVEELPEYHDALVTLLGEMKPQSDTRQFESGLGHALGERWLYVDPDIRLADRQDYHEAWFNLNHFAALVYKADVQDLSDFGFRTLWLALKRGRWHVGWDVPGSISDSMLAFEGHFPAAAHWIALCGQRLYNENNDVKGKWAEWEGNLDWVVGQNDLNDTIRSQCKETLAEMRRISPTA
ncbi:hypothetical protein DXG01_008771 [Tephrocybe rancida]|nr:hypothetical protein DXG01_008771 [Tephrocybe rancida]